MIEAEALDPNKWNVGCFYSKSGRVGSVNLLPTLYVDLAAMDLRSFRKLDKSGIPVDPDRFALLRIIVDTINSWQLDPTTTVHHARSLKRFVRWADERKGTLSRTTIVPLLANYRGDSSSLNNALRRAAAQGLDLTDEERALLFPPVVPIESTTDDWVVTLDTKDHKRKADFLRFVAPGIAALPFPTFAKKRKRLLFDAVDDPSGRAQLIRALREEFKACATARLLRPKSLVSYFRNLRVFIVWADDQELAIDNDSAMETLVLYSQDLKRQLRAGKVSPKTVAARLSPVMRFLAEVLGRQPFEIRYQLSLPSVKSSGWTSARPETSLLRQFCSNLHAIVRALPSEMLCASIRAPIQVKLWSGGEALCHDLPGPLGRYGDQGFDPRLANLPFIRLRICAEMHRFIAFTGCNLSVAQDITIGDWKSAGQRLEALKARANKFISARTGEWYARHIDAHVAFLKAVMPEPIKDDTPLFPEFRFSQRGGPRAIVAAMRAGTAELRTTILEPGRKTGLFRWAETKLPTLTSRQLRQAKATWVLRRYSGDSLRVAQALGNKPGTANDYYGGKGNLEQAMVEWSAFWDSSQSQSALAPGKCRSPGRYEPIISQDQPSGSCNEGACLTCRHYRGEDSLDYVHRMLSYRYYLCFQAASNSTVSQLIDIIDWIVDEYLALNVDQRDAVHHLRAQIGNRPHPRFAAMIRLKEIIHAA